MQSNYTKSGTFILLLFSVSFFSCSNSVKQNARSYCETHSSPIPGKYYRTSNDTYKEYIELVNDSTYKYFYYDYKTKDSCTSSYEFSGRKYINGELQCEIVFHNFRFFYKHLQSGNDDERKDSTYNFYCPYVVTDSSAYIQSDPFEDFGQFELRLR